MSILTDDTARRHAAEQYVRASEANSEKALRALDRRDPRYRDYAKRATIAIVRGREEVNARPWFREVDCT